MKKFLALFFAISLIFVFVSCGGDKNPDTKDPATTDSSSAQKVTVTLENYSDFKLTSIAISKSGEDKWSKNLISQELEPTKNTTIQINLPENKDDAMFDLSGVTSDGQTIIFRFLDLSELTEAGGKIYLASTEGGDGFANFAKPE